MRFDYERRGEEFHVFDRLGEQGSDRPLARCQEVWVAELLVKALKERELQLELAHSVLGELPEEQKALGW